MEKKDRLTEPALVLQGVTKRFYKKPFAHAFCLDHISFTLERGYMLGLIGRNGAGKSSLLKLIMNRLPKKAGTIRIAGYDLDREGNRAVAKIGYLGDENFFMERETLLTNAKLFAPLYDTFHMERFVSLLRRFELGEQKKAGELSKGMRTKFQLAFALAHEPELLLMDEPTGGLDPVFRKEFLYLLQEELEQEKAGVLFSTHITEDLDKAADYIAMLEDGKLLFFESKEALSDRLKKPNGERMTLEEMMIREISEQKGWQE